MLYIKFKDKLRVTRIGNITKSHERLRTYGHLIRSLKTSELKRALSGNSEMGGDQ